jgi:hypothetical protein
MNFVLHHGFTLFVFVVSAMKTWKATPGGTRQRTSGGILGGPK